MVDPITLQHVGFAVGVVGIVLGTKVLFDIAESAKHDRTSPRKNTSTHKGRLWSRR